MEAVVRNAALSDHMKYAHRTLVSWLYSQLQELTFSVTDGEVQENFCGKRNLFLEKIILMVAIALDSCHAAGLFFNATISTFRKKH